MSEGATAYRQFNGHLIPCNHVNLTNKSICNMFPKTKTRKKRRNEINMSIMETDHEKYEIKTCWNILFNKDIVIKWTWSNLYTVVFAGVPLFARRDVLRCYNGRLQCKLFGDVRVSSLLQDGSNNAVRLDCRRFSIAFCSDRLCWIFVHRYPGKSRNNL